MTAPLSIIIPTLNAAEAVAPLLSDLVEGVGAGLVKELLITDGGSQDDVAQIAEGVGARLVVGAPGRGGQLARGAAAARGDWLLFLHADSRLPPGWSAVVERFLRGASPSAPNAAVFRLLFDDAGFAARWVAGWANTRTRLAALPYGDQGLLIARAHYDDVGGYPDQPLMEDVAIARAIGRRRLEMLPIALTTSADRYRRDGWMKRGLKNWTCLILYYLGTSPERIAERYR